MTGIARAPRKAFAIMGRLGADYIIGGDNIGAKLNLAYDQLSAAGGGTLLLRSGLQYRLEREVTGYETVKIVGEKFAKASAGGTIIRAAEGTNLTHMFNFAGTSSPSANTDLLHDIGFEDITLNGNLTATNILTLSNTDYAMIRHVRFVGAANSIKTVWDSNADPISSTIPGGLRIQDCIISANSGIGIDLQYQTQSWIRSCWFSGNNVQKWINLKSCNKITIDGGNEFNVATVGVSFNDTPTLATNDIALNGNRFAIGSGNKNWEDTRTNPLSSRISIVGNTIAGGTRDPLVGDDNMILNTGDVR